jgi:glycerol-3-phosphate dehydrogenase subunit C
VSREDRWLGNVDALRAAASVVAPLANWANGFKPHRALMEAVVGVHRGYNLPKFHHKTFARWFRERQSAAAPEAEGRRKVALFYSCSVNYNEPQVGRDTVSVLEKNRCAVSCPAQVCCGMPCLDGGDIGRAQENARRNVTALLPLRCRPRRPTPSPPTARWPRFRSRRCAAPSRLIRRRCCARAYER